MNKAITEGVVFMPTTFGEGLSVWSRGDGVPGSNTYASLATAAYVPADQDFAGCLELQKTDAVQKLRYMGQTAILPGCYLRVTARVKVISGNLPAVRIAGWAGTSGGGHVAGLTEVGPSTALTGYGEVVEVSAIIGTGNRGGVDMVWGMQPTYGHFGLDLTGPTGGVVRIDDIVIEDITDVFLRDLINTVDVRDYGAVGNGTTDDSAAFEAADADADGREIFVSKGTFYLGQSVTLDNRVAFEGSVTMPVDAILSLTRNFDLPAYIDAFGGDEEMALKKAIQSLLNNADHESLDLGGRRVSLTEQLDVQAAVPNRDSYAQRRVIRNGQLRAETSGTWDPIVVTSQASYSASNSTRLTGVTNVANVRVGSLVEGAGVGREIYVRSKNIAAQEVTLSQPLSDAQGTQNYTFTRFRYLLDFSGFDRLDQFALDDIEFQCAELASGVLLSPLGTIMQFSGCTFNRPGHRGITSPGEGCQGMLIDNCQFISAEGGVLTQNRKSVAINANANDVKVRNCRASQFRHFVVLSGAQSVVQGNHVFQGDPASSGIRSAGILLCLKATNATITGNYVDNCHIEWTNEREPEPDYVSGFGFAGLTITDNVFLSSNVAPWFSFIVVKPYGTGHFLNGFNVSGNTFRCVGTTMNKVERVDTSFAELDLTKMKKVSFSNNTFNNIEYAVANPAVVSHSQNTHAAVWPVSFANKLPFNGLSKDVDAVVLRGRLRNEANVSAFDNPHTEIRLGPNQDQIHLTFSAPMRGDVNVTARMD
ncbi:glycosyl hydrolase family 28-related protein [Puniceibacterium sp. IMCC21224]|uniref:glycosyl hydrolase family 28-related protein n=1 Tax=Puniceibacterium sp. IMCC21224 TaxID=1618204 RepID=UPI00064E0907|nr:glycosyl hydrolase family 28-related protein [Puniceibacterium sp. IMCC21224]KMK66367.1 Pectate lyase superfamily protein/Right handed beta helix region [Puniceibacterium sp. IMCC21224]